MSRSVRRKCVRPEMLEFIKSPMLLIKRYNIDISTLAGSKLWYNNKNSNREIWIKPHTKTNNECTISESFQLYLLEKEQRESWLLFCFALLSLRYANVQGRRRRRSNGLLALPIQRGTKTAECRKHKSLPSSYEAKVMFGATRHLFIP